VSEREHNFRTRIFRIQSRARIAALPLITGKTRQNAAQIPADS